MGLDVCVLPDAGMSPKITGELLRLLRNAMRNCKYVSEPIQAYIIPSGDAHQVIMSIDRTPPHSIKESPNRIRFSF